MTKFKLAQNRIQWWDFSMLVIDILISKIGLNTLLCLITVQVHHYTGNWLIRSCVTDEKAVIFQLYLDNRCPDQGSKWKPSEQKQESYCDFWFKQPNEITHRTVVMETQCYCQSKLDLFRVDFTKCIEADSVISFRVHEISIILLQGHVYKNARIKSKGIIKNLKPSSNYVSPLY